MTAEASASPIALRPEAQLLDSGQRYSWLDLVKHTNNGVRETLMMNGTAPRLEDLAGFEFRGGNALVVTRLLGIRKFVKGFYEGPARAQGPEPFVQGYNAKVRQNADEAEHLLKPSPEHPKRHDFFRVYAASANARDNRYPNSLLLDYGLGGNGIFGAPLRDYLVQVYPDDRDLLLGKAYVAILGMRIPVGFFVLQRMRQVSFSG